MLFPATIAGSLPKPAWLAEPERLWAPWRFEGPALDAAKREFEEEMGSAPAGEFQPLGTLKQPSGKVIHAWAAEADFDCASLQSNLFSMEWPPKSGRMDEFPEIDRAAWFSIDQARMKILKGQAPFLDRLLEITKNK